MLLLIRLWIASLFIHLAEFNRDIAVLIVDGKWPTPKKQKYIVTR